MSSPNQLLALLVAALGEEHLLALLYCCFLSLLQEEAPWCQPSHHGKQDCWGVLKGLLCTQVRLRKLAQELLHPAPTPCLLSNSASPPWAAWVVHPYSYVARLHTLCSVSMTCFCRRACSSLICCCTRVSCPCNSFFLSAPFAFCDSKVGIQNAR